MFEILPCKRDSQVDLVGWFESLCQRDDLYSADPDLSRRIYNQPGIGFTLMKDWPFDKPFDRLRASSGPFRRKFTLRSKTLSEKGRLLSIH